MGEKAWFQWEVDNTRNYRITEKHLKKEKVKEKKERESKAKLRKQINGLLKLKDIRKDTPKQKKGL